MTTYKQNFARRRNWTKARLKSIAFDTRVLTDEERLVIASIRTSINALLDEWDNNSEKLGMKVERFNLIVNGDTSPFVKKNISRTDVQFYTNNLNKNDYKIEKI